MSYANTTIDYSKSKHFVIITSYAIYCLNVWAFFVSLFSIVPFIKYFIFIFVNSAAKIWSNAKWLSTCFFPNDWLVIVENQNRSKH